MKTRTTLLALTVAFALTTPFALSQKRGGTNDPAVAAKDPDFALQGEYTNGTNGVQVVALGHGKFQAAMLKGGLPGAGWDKSDRVFSNGSLEDGMVTFENGGRIKDGAFHMSGAKLGKIDRSSPTLGAKPPAGALVLFDGSSAEAWQKGRLDGELLCEGTNSKQTFGDFKLHLEFRTPWKPNTPPGNQDRGNSGLYIFNRYETQIIDSFGIVPQNNLCGSLYKTKTTDLNMCLPPMTWQTYDIDFTAPKFDADGKKTANARITTRHNGVVIHDDVELLKGTGAGGRRPEIAEGALFLQGHGNPVRYRNIWIVEKADPAND